MQNSNILENNKVPPQGDFSRYVSITTPAPIPIEFQPSDNSGLKSRKTLQKRAKAKFYTNSIVAPLIHYAIGVNSPLLKTYRNAFYCNCTLRQSGQTITGTYCNTRVCHTCNRIRTGRLINQYLPEISNWKELWFLTLTIPNVKDNKLKETFIEMNKKLSLIQKNLKEKKGYKAKGIIKWECTYRFIRKDFHPHFHLICDDFKYAELVKVEWLKRWPDAVEEAQLLIKGNRDSLKELFKYTTKIIETEKGKKTKGKIIANVNLKALDIILNVIHTKRVIRAFGFSAKQEEIDVEFDGLKSQKYYDLPHDRGELVSSTFFDYSTHTQNTREVPSFVKSIEYHWYKHDWFYDTRDYPFINPEWKPLFYNDEGLLVTTIPNECDNELNPYINPKWEPLFALSEYVPPEPDSKYYVHFKFFTKI